MKFKPFASSQPVGHAFHCELLPTLGRDTGVSVIHIRLRGLEFRYTV
jgi:hypothetical protein